MSMIDLIVFTESDVLKKGKQLYEIERTIKGEENDSFGDGSHIIFVNSQVQDDTALGELMRDFYCVKPEDMVYSILAEETRNHKYERGREKMCRSFEKIAKQWAAEEREEGRAEGREEGREEEKVYMVTTLISDGQYSLEKIALMAKMPIEKVRELAESIRQNI